MSNKSISEALAAIQRKVNEQRTKNAEGNWKEVQEDTASELAQKQKNLDDMTPAQRAMIPASARRKLQNITPQEVDTRLQGAERTATAASLAAGAPAAATRGAAAVAKSAPSVGEKISGFLAGLRGGSEASKAAALGPKATQAGAEYGGAVRGTVERGVTAAKTAGDKVSAAAAANPVKTAVGSAVAGAVGGAAASNKSATNTSPSPSPSTTPAPTSTSTTPSGIDPKDTRMSGPDALKGPGGSAAPAVSSSGGVSSGFSVAGKTVQKPAPAAPAPVGSGRGNGQIELDARKAAAQAPKQATKPAAPQAQSQPAPKPDFGYAQGGSDADTSANFFSANAREMQSKGQKASNDFSSETESGGKTKGKKMSESTLINAALSLIGKENMFVEAKKMKGGCPKCGKSPCQCGGDIKEEKKAKKDYDGDGKVESPKDEVWGSRFKAAKKAGKMEEESSSDPDMAAPRPGGEKKKGDIEFKPQEAPKSPIAPAKDAPMPPKKPAGLKENSDQIDEGGNPVNKAKKNAAVAAVGSKNKDDQYLDRMNPDVADKIRGREKMSGVDRQQYKEEVSFSEAELAHIAAIMEADAPAKAPTDANKNYKVDAKGSERGTGPTAGDLTDETVIDEARGRPKGSTKADVNPNTEQGRDPRQHIQVIAGQAAAGRVMDFKHNNGEVTKISPAMGRKIGSHLSSLKPADKQSAVNKMHDSAEGLKV